MSHSGRILIVGNHGSPLTWERGHVGLQGGYEIYWYYLLPLQRCSLEGLSGVFSPSKRLNRFAGLLSPVFLTKVIRKIQPDLIHVFYAGHYADALVLSRFRPLVVTVMGGDILPDQAYNGPWKNLTKMTLDAADIITSKSEFLDKALMNIGDYKNKIRRITWGINMKVFSPDVNIAQLRRQWNIWEGETVFFCPRLCLPFYKKDLIIQAFGLYLRRSVGVKAKLLVAELFAEDEYCRYLRSLVSECGVDEQVRFVGALSHSDMPTYFALADVMISFAPSDGMPQSLYEAMACCAFPVLSDLPQYHEIIKDRVNGRLVPAGDVEALAEALQWSVIHESERRRMTIANRKSIVEMADKDTQDGLVNSLYDELCSRGRSTMRS